MKTFYLKAFGKRKTFTTLGWVNKWITKNKPNFPTNDYFSKLAPVVLQQRVIFA